MEGLGRFSRRSILVGMASLGVGGAALAACGQVAPAPADAPETKEEPEPEPTAAPEAMEPTVIKYMHFTTQQEVWDNTYGAVIDRYVERNPDVQVELDIVTWPLTDVAVKAVAASAAGISYDMYYGWFGYISQFATADIIQPLDPFIAKDADVDLSEYYEGALERIGGNLYGIAWFLGARSIWYNDDIMTNEGLTSPADLDAAGNLNWDSLTELATKLTTREGANVTRWGLSFNGNAHSSIVIALKSWGAGWWNEDFTAPAIDSPAAAEAVQTVLDHVIKHQVHPPLNRKETDVAPNFTEQKLGMVLTGPWYTRTINQEIVEGQTPFNVDLANVPLGPGGRGTPLLINAFWIARSSPQPDATWDFYKYLISEEVQPDWANLGGGRFPPNRTYTPAVQYPFENVETYKAIADVSIPLRQAVKQSDINGAWSELWGQMEAGEKTVAEAVAEAQQVSAIALQEGGCIC
ncbi:MAG: extracellular solute-binding protein [Chloroflexi bacterium]|nr:extracellular solute-binding protein [Chloroflexota bacterium]